MNVSQIKEKHERNHLRPSFFQLRKGLKIHRVRKVSKSVYYMVFSTDRIRDNSFMHYRIAKFFEPTGMIWVLGSEGSTAATKFVKFHCRGEFPHPEEVDENVALDNSRWHNGSKIYR